MTEAQLIPLKAAAASYGIGYSSLWTAVQKGDLYAEKSRGRWRVRPQDVLAWLREAPDFTTNGVERTP